MLPNTEVNGETEYRTTTGKLKLRENDSYRPLQWAG